jgi:hypothetical protein
MHHDDTYEVIIQNTDANMFMTEYFPSYRKHT